MKTLEEVIRKHVQDVLAMCGGRKPVAAKALGITPKTLYNWLKKWNSN